MIEPILLSDEMIRWRSFEIWRRQGEGKALDHWLQAKMEMEAIMDTVSESSFVLARPSISHRPRKSVARRIGNRPPSP